MTPTARPSQRERPPHHGVPPLTPQAALRYDLVRRIVRDLQPGSIAEIGCGQGAVGARLAEVADYTGVEPDSTSFETAAARVQPRGGQVLHGTSEALPPGSTYDLVCAFEVLEHIEDDDAALAQWVRHVAPGGHLLLSVPAFQDRFGASDTYVGHFRRYEPDDLRAKLVAAGLEDVRVGLYGWPLGFALEAVRNRVLSRRLEKAAGTPVSELTSASGRTLQPSGRVQGLAIEAATAPFRYLQRLRTAAGTGLVAVARRPR